MAFVKKWEFDASEPFDCMMRGYDYFRSPLPKRAPMEVFPKMFSWDEKFLLGLRELTRQLNDHPGLQPKLDDNLMVGENGIHTTFDRCRTVAGYSMSPLSWIPVDNSELCKTLEIPDDFRNDRHRQIFDEMFTLVFSNWKPSSIKVPKLSTLGFPMMWNYDASYKREAALFLFDNIEIVLQLVDADNYAALASDYGMVWCFNTNRRGQVDNPGKVRKVFDLLYALSGGQKGKVIEADKRVRLPDGSEWPDFSATRERVVQGASWMLNCIIQVVSSGHMYAMFDMFPRTFHHTDPNDIAREAALAGDATFSDVADYDRSMRTFLLERMFDRMRDYWDDRVVKIAELLYFAGYYSRPVSADKTAGREHGFVGDPMRPDLRPVKAGNRSGHAMTSLVAKMMKVFDSLCVIDDLTKDVVGNVSRYLRHEMGVKLVNNGDDEGAIGSKAMIASYRSIRYDGKHGYFSISPEEGQAFSGSLIIWRGEGTALPRLHTTFEKMYCPERSIGKKFRPRWPIGFLTRLEAFQNHPSGHIAEEIHRKIWKDYWEPYYGSLSEILVAAMERLDVQFDGLTAIEKEVLDDPEKLYYKYSDSDVSEAVLDKAVSRIKPSEFEWALKKFKGFVI